MIARAYKPEDFEAIAQWGKEWGSSYDSDLFPQTGFIVDGLAAWFLYKTDSKVCYLENLVSNPKAPEHERDSAITAVINATVSEAERLGFRVLYATTDIPKVIERALLMGASVKAKQALVSKTL